jgi:RNase H-fold protein (predicted Holliday junction resolvase)
MYAIGIDVGGSYTGIAESLYGDIATAVCVLKTPELLPWLQLKISKHPEMIVVIGTPKTDTKQNQNSLRIESLVTKIESLGSRVVLVDETNTTGFALSLSEFVHGTVRGESRVAKSERMDATSAAMILQRYLDTQTTSQSLMDQDDWDI